MGPVHYLDWYNPLNPLSPTLHYALFRNRRIYLIKVKFTVTVIKRRLSACLVVCIVYALAVAPKQTAKRYVKGTENYIIMFVPFGSRAFSAVVHCQSVVLVQFSFCRRCFSMRLARAGFRMRVCSPEIQKG